MAPTAMTVPQAATYLGRTQGRIRQLILDGHLPATKVGRDWVLMKADLARWKRKAPAPGRPKQSRRDTR